MIKIFVTGPPGIGKTTCVYKVFEMLRLYGYRVGGFITREVREGGKRIGFRIIELDEGLEDWLANIHETSRYRIGKYYVFVDKLDSIINSIENKITSYDALIFDEIGPMELLSSKFNTFIQRTLNIPVPTVYTVHHKISNELNKRFNTRYENVLYILTTDNREGMPLIIWKALSKYLQGMQHDMWTRRSR